MSASQRRLDLRKGARVRWQVGNEIWRNGKLVRANPTGEEWLVENRLGRFWIAVMRLEPAEE